MPPSSAPRHRTLWEEGRHSGRLVTQVALTATLLAALAHLPLGADLGLAFDVVFVLSCLGAALAVRPRDFFVAGVLPPLLLAGTVMLLALVSRGVVADERDGLVQAIVSGLAHHAGPLVVAYGLSLAVLAVRQVALRHDGAIRVTSRPPTHSA